MLHTQQLIDSQAVSDMPQRHSDAVRVDQYTRAIPRLTKYEQECAAFESQAHELPTVQPRITASEIVNTALAKLTVSLSDTSGAALIGFKQPEQWHDGPPPVPGVYEIRIHKGGSTTYARFFDGGWTGHDIDPKCGFSNGHNWMMNTDGFVQWLRLIEADKPPVAEKGVWIEWNGLRMCGLSTN